MRKPPIQVPLIGDNGLMQREWALFFNLTANDISTLDHSGNCFSARAAATTLTAGAFTKIIFSTEDFDPLSEYDATTNYRYTPLTAGKYQVNAFVGITYTNANKITAIALYKNGSRLKQFGHVTGNATYTSRGLSALIDMNGTTDYLEIYVYHNDSVDASIDTATYASHFSAYLI